VTEIILVLACHHQILIPLLSCVGEGACQGLDNGHIGLGSCQGVSACSDNAKSFRVDE